MSKIIAREVPPEQCDFSYYFYDDGMKSVGGENCAVYIPGDRRNSGFNYDEYQEIQAQAENIIDGFHDVSDKWTNGYDSYATYKEAMEFNGVVYNSHKCHLLKEWSKNADVSSAGCMAKFLTITTGEEWQTRNFRGYSQGDYCEVIYCKAHYSEDSINEIGHMWLGCGTEFCIDDCHGCFVLDSIRWTEDERLVKHLADCVGCDSKDLEVQLYKGSHSVADYETLVV